MVANPYCDARCTIEERGWTLALKLASISIRLRELAGKDHQAFIETQRKCHDLRTQLAANRKELHAHREVHKC